MKKFYSIVIFSLLLLDVAVLPVGCPGKTPRRVTQVGCLFYEVLYANEDTRNQIRVQNQYNGEYYPGSVITQDIIDDILFIEGIDKESLLDVRMYDHGEGLSIDLPYTITETDVLTYYRGIREASHLRIYINK